MNEFVITYNGKKVSVGILSDKRVKINGAEYNAVLSRVDNKSYLLIVDNKVFEITYNRIEKDKFGLLIGSSYYELYVRTKLEEAASEILKKKSSTHKHDVVKAPMPGLILKINKQKGDSVKIGDPLFLLEAMKMENEIRSPITGTIKELMIKEGTSVEKDEIILTFE